MSNQQALHHFSLRELREETGVERGKVDADAEDAGDDGASAPEARSPRRLSREEDVVGGM